ncbi:MAG: acyltransferase [Spartobacteria bacterium]
MGLTARKIDKVDNAAAAVDPRPAAHRRPGLDLLRALAILLVVLYHAGLFGFELPFDVQRFGWVGVDLFFVLSGYLIAGQLCARIARGDRPNLTVFYHRRALRILPAYLVIVAIYFLLPATWREYPTIPPLWKFLSFTQNLGLRGGTSFSHAWSLCIEAQFYLLLPFVILALARKPRPLLIMLIPGMVLAGEVLIRATLAHVNASSPTPTFGWWQQWIYYPTYARLDSLTLGVSLAAMESFRPTWWAALLKTARWIWLPGLSAIVIALVLAKNGLSGMSSAVGFLLVAAGMGAFLICAVSPRLPFSRIAIPGAAFLATIAYSVYLSHKLAIHAVELLAANYSVPPIPAYGVMLLSILLAGAALFFAIERPYLQMREEKKRRD